jgi:DNA ligase 1
MVNFKQGKTFKPMRAASTKDKDLEQLLMFPLLASPKVDGIRCVTNPQGLGHPLLSNTLKPIRNKHIQKMLRALPPGLDGELVGIPDNRGTDYMLTHEGFPQFNDVTSAIMSEDGVPSFSYLVFDYYAEWEMPFLERIQRAKTIVQQCQAAGIKHVHLLLSVTVPNYQAFLDYHNKNMEAGFEGTMLRELTGGYKWGRSTLREGLLLKVKKGMSGLDKVREEAEIIGFQEQMHDPVEVKRRELRNLAESEDLTVANSAKKALLAMHGAAKKDSLVPADTLGAFLVRDVKTGVEFRVGTGPILTKEGRQNIWDNQDDYLGKILSYECFPYGDKDKPRHPVAVGFRHEDDLVVE